MQPILFKSVGSLVLFLKAYHIENLNSQNVQSLIPMGKDRSFGNTFWLYNFRIFDIIKFVTFRKSWGHILELYAKALHKICENTDFHWPVFSRIWTESQILCQSLSQCGVTQCFWSRAPRLGIQYPNH